MTGPDLHDPAMSHPVGPVLRMSDDVDGVVAAIRDDNPETPIEIIDRGAYVRVQSNRSMRLTRATLQQHLGTQFELRDLEVMMGSFAGRIRTSSDEIVWEFRSTSPEEAPR